MHGASLASHTPNLGKEGCSVRLVRHHMGVSIELGDGERAWG